jgi:copper chaperone NosL
MKRFLTAGSIIFVLGLMMLMGCGAEASLDEPPVILYGQDVCDECNMIINEAKHAAAYVTTSGEARRFDDIGDMLAYNARNREDVHLYWVHDFNNEEWVRADQAAFVLNSGRPTPMGWGILAFADQAAAEMFIADGAGRIATWAELLAMMDDGSLSSEMGISGTHERLMIRLGRDQMCGEGHGQLVNASTVAGDVTGQVEP